MLNGVVSRINGFIGGINQGLEALGSERRISLVPDLDLGEIENRFEGAATAATTAAQAAFDRAFEDNPLDRARSRSDRGGEPGARVRERSIAAPRAIWPKGPARRSKAGRRCAMPCAAPTRRVPMR